MSRLHTVTIIHGKGTGALRAAVRQQLKRHPAVKTFRTAYRDVIYDMLYGEQYIAGAANRVRD